MAIEFPDISPIALEVGPVVIRWYALAYLAGFLLGWRYALSFVARDAEKEPKERFWNKLDIDDFLPWAIVGVILGGRIGYVLFYQFDMYMAHPSEILKVWHGGMSFHGGTLGVMAAMIAYSWKRQKPLLRLTDIICSVVPIGLFFGRIANFVNGELFGRVTDVAWGVIFPRGGPLPRHPSQLYEALLEGAVLFTVLALLARWENIRAKPGVLTGVFLIGYGLSRIIVEFFRQPDPQIGLIDSYFTMGQILSMPMIIGGLALIFWARRNASCRENANGKS